MPCLALVLTVFGAPGIAPAQTKTATTTTIAVTSGGGAVTTVASGSAVTLTASVTAGTAALITGQVNFCDASAKSCTDIHLFGMAQLTSAGTAVLTLRPGIGSHSYKAVFLGTKSKAVSASSTSPLTVTGTPGPFATTTAIAESGSWGKYKLSATVAEIGGTAAPTGNVSFLDTSAGNAALGTGTLAAGTQGVGWLSSQFTPTTTNTGAVAVGDFNGDGLPDIAEINAGNSNVTILLSNGDGTFAQTETSPQTGSSWNALTVGDFNGDGIQDLALVNSPNNTVTILLGKGDGTFTATAASPAIGMYADGIVTGDFNGDGIADLAVLAGYEQENSTLTILLGKGDGSFKATSASPAAGDGANGIAVGDFNGDGKTDIAVIDQDSETLTVLLGNGDGTFTAGATPQITDGALSISTADFNGDGIPDLIVGCSNGGQVFVLLGNGDGSFTAAPAFPTANTQPAALAVADFNGDGIPDVAILNVTSSALPGTAIFFGNGDGSFVPSPISPPGNSDPKFLAAGDFNGDGRTDLIVANDFSNQLAIYLTEPTQTAIATANIPLPTAGLHQVDASYGGSGEYNSSVSGTTPLWGVPPATSTTLTLTSGGAPATSVATGSVVTLTATVTVGASPVTAGQVSFCDASAKFCTDIHLLGTVVLTKAGTATFKFVPGPGTYSYKAVFVEDGFGMSSSSSVSTLTVGPAASPAYTDSAAITLDGQPADYSLTATVSGVGGPATPTGTISFLDTSFGNQVLATAKLGAGTPAAGWLESQTPALSSVPASEVAGDFNGDGIPDLAEMFTNSNDMGAVTILLGKGDGTFKTGSTTEAVVAGQMFSYMITGDFNGDGKTDLALLNYSGFTSISTVTTFLGKGDGTFTVSATSTVSSQGNMGGDYIQGSMVAADFNGDGKLDLAVVGDDISSGGVTIVLGNGDGTFTATGQSIEASRGLSLIVTGDFNGDHIPDLFVSEQYSSSTGTTLLGNGDGTFTATTSSLTLGYPYAFVAGDFNGDGVLDLAVSNNPGVLVFLGHGDGTFKQEENSPSTGGSFSLISGDFNHDGKMDLAGVDQYDDAITLFLGAGDGTFSVTSAIPTGAGQVDAPDAIVASDFNGDGVPDLAALSSSGDTVSILLTEPTSTATATVNGIAPQGAGTHNVEASYTGDGNYKSTVSGTVALMAGVATPKLSPPPGTYTSTQTITMTDATPGATIHYELYGPIYTSGYVVYTGPITLSQAGTEIILIYADKPGYQSSGEQQLTYNLDLPPSVQPVISLPSGVYSNAQTVTITDSAPGTTIYYTTNGSFPTNASTQYTGPITVSTSETLVAAAAAPGFSFSTAAVGEYVISSSPASFMYTVAGNEATGYGGDGGPATTAYLNQPTRTAVDKSGNLYIADMGNNVVRKVAAGTGIITTVAGSEISGYSGDGGAATKAQLAAPTGVALDTAGNLYIADYGNNVIRKVTAATGTITTYAGGGSGDSGGPATSAYLSQLSSITVDGSNNLYILESGLVVKVDPATGILSNFAGNGGFGFAGDGGPAINATLELPFGIAADSAGNLFIADSYNNRIRKVTAASGTISTIAGSGTSQGFASGSFGGDGGPATSAQLNTPQGVGVDNAGNVYIADTWNHVLRKVTASSGIITTIAGNLDYCGAAGGDGSVATSTSLCLPEDVSVSAAGNLYLADTYLESVKEVAVSALPPTAVTASPQLSLSPGTYPGPQTLTITDSTPGAEIYVTLDGSPVTTLSPGYNGPIDVSGNLTVNVVALASGHLISSSETAAYTIASPPSSVITTFAGSGLRGFSGSGGAATSAELDNPAGVALDASGNLYFTDVGSNVVWKVAAASGKITNIAGNGTGGFGGDGGPATDAKLNTPQSIAVNHAGDVYIADSTNNVVRKVSAATGIITTVVGTGQTGQSGKIGDGGPAIDAQLNRPSAVAFDSAGNLYVADSNHRRIREVMAATGIIQTVVGNGNDGNDGDGGPAASATLGFPNALAFDSAGNLFIAIIPGHVRKVTAATGIITAIAGNGDRGTTGDGGPATSAEIDPQGLAVDSAGNVYISNSEQAVREVAAGTGIITRVVGNGYYGEFGDGGPATIAELANPQGIAFDSAGNLYIADSYADRIRKVASPSAAAAPVFSLAAGTYPGSQTVTITDASQGSVIYYTTDGTTPTTDSIVYSGPIAVTQTETLQAIAAGPGYTQSPVVKALYTIRIVVTPAVTETPSASSITTQQQLTVAVGVAGGGSNPTPTGTVTLTSGGYSAQLTLAAGTASFTIAAGALPAGSDTLTATYAPDASSSGIYASATQTASVTVTLAAGTAVATVSATPSVSTIDNQQDVTIQVSVAGASGQPVPTGHVTLASGGYSAEQALAAGSASFDIPPGALAPGADTLTVTYLGDATYAVATGSTAVTVAPVVVTVPTPPAVSPGGNAAATVTLSAGSNYSGTMTLTCALTGSPAGAQDLPTCSLNPASVTIASGKTASSTLKIQTTAATAALQIPLEQKMPWLGGGTALAALLLFGIPARRRRWLSRISLLLFVFAAGSILIGCGGGSGGGGGITPPPSNPGTTAGSYTFTVTGTDSANASITTTAKITVTVQ